MVTFTKSRTKFEPPERSMYRREAFHKSSNNQFCLKDLLSPVNSGITFWYLDRHKNPLAKRRRFLFYFIFIILIRKAYHSLACDLNHISFTVTVISPALALLFLIHCILLDHCIFVTKIRWGAEICLLFFYFRSRVFTAGR